MLHKHKPPALASHGATLEGPTETAQSGRRLPKAGRRCRGSRRLAALGRGVRMFAYSSNQRRLEGCLKKVQLERLGTWLIGAIFDEKHLTAISRTTRVHIITATVYRATRRILLNYRLEFFAFASAIQLSSRDDPPYSSRHMPSDGTSGGVPPVTIDHDPQTKLPVRI